MDVEVRIRSLLWGFRPIQIAIPNSDPCFLLVRDLTTVEHAIVDAKVQKFEYRCSKLGLIKKDELLKELAQRRVWMKGDEDNIKAIEKEIRGLENDRRSIYKGNPHKQKRCDVKINVMKIVLNKTNEHKSELLSPAFEFIVEYFRLFNVLQKTTYKEDEALLWPTISDIMNDKDRFFLTSVITEYNRTSLTTSELREIARSSLWRFRWNVGKNNVRTLFGKDFTELTLEQESLIYWSQVYDSVYESIDRPADYVIDNDETLDQWFEQQRHKNRGGNKEKTSFGKRNAKVEKQSGYSKEEIFTIVGSKEEADAIKAENAPSVNAAIEKKLKKVAEKGGVASDAEFEFKIK